MTGVESAEAAAQLFVALIAAAAVVALLARRIAFPYTVALVALGLVVAIVGPPIDLELIPGLVLLVLIPGLVFEAAYRIELHDLRPVSGLVAVLPGPGVLFGAVVIGLLLHVVAGFEPGSAFLVGAMVSATDPAAVVATSSGSTRHPGCPRWWSPRPCSMTGPAWCCSASRSRGSGVA